MTDDAPLVKLHVPLPNHWATGGEALWARDLGGDRYQIDNVPFHIYGLNYRDIVRAVSPAPDERPRILEVLVPSGHQTIRVLFPEKTPEAERVPFLTSLKRFGATFEGRDAHYFALDVPPTGDYEGLRDHLEELVARAFLSYETCEPRVPGSFDEVPPTSERPEDAS